MPHDQVVAAACRMTKQRRSRGSPRLRASAHSPRPNVATPPASGGSDASATSSTPAAYHCPGHHARDGVLLAVAEVVGIGRVAGGAGGAIGAAVAFPAGAAAIPRRDADGMVAAVAVAVAGIAGVAGAALA